MAKDSKDFLVSTADVAFYHNDVLAFTGTTSLNTSLNVTMEDAELTGGKGNKLLYKYKFGRKVASTIEVVEWRLEYIASQIGTPIVTGLQDVYAVAECVTLVAGVGTLKRVPVGKVHVEKADGSIVEITPVGSTVTIDTEDGSVKATYKYNKSVKRVTIDAESTPMVGELILTADKHNNKLGKVGEVQIVIPSFQLNGNFDINLEASGNTTTSLAGDALAVEGDSCADGQVYAYITEIEDGATSVSVNDISATPSVVTLAVAQKKKISVIGIKGGLYSNISIDTADCTIASSDVAIATVANGEITAVAKGDAIITVTYDGIKDVIKVTVA